MGSIEGTADLKKEELTPVTDLDAGNIKEETISKEVTENGTIETKAVEMTPEQKAFQEENEKAMKELEAKYGLTKEQIQKCMSVEIYISDPGNKITTLIQAMDVYKSENLTEGQMLFLAVNANSRANMFRNDAEQFHANWQQAAQQLQALSKLTQLKMDAETKKAEMSVVKDEVTVDEGAQGTEETVED